MERLHIAATKSNLIRLKDELRFAREGKELLSQKREVLVMELLRLQDDAQRARDELEDILRQAYGHFVQAAMREGFAALAAIALAVPGLKEIRIEERSVMGVVIPIVEPSVPPWEPGYGLARGSVATDLAAELFRTIAEKLCEVAEIETAIYRLAMETRKTLRRERALENLFIPQSQATVKFIRESLEEKEREGYFQMKLLKKKWQK